MKNYYCPNRLVFFGENPQPKTQESVEHLGNDFEVKITTAAARKIEIRDNKLRQKDSTKDIADFDENTKKVEASIYICPKCPISDFLEIKIDNKDGSAQTIWIDSFGQLLLYEPKNGAMDTKDMIRLLGG